MKENLKSIPSSPDYTDLMESMAHMLSSYRQYEFPQNPGSLDEEVINRLFKYDTLLFSDSKTRLAFELGGLQRYLND
jgi:rRNA maturation protein Rpf1